MIVVDTSALMAIVLGEPKADLCKHAIQSETDILISAGTVTELLIVSGRRGIVREVQTLIDKLSFETVPVTAATARAIGELYRRWGKGFHPAGLNFGDCFAYELARDRGCKLLFVGRDFSKTDIGSVLEEP